MRVKKLGCNHTEEWKTIHSIKMKGNTYRKGKKSSLETREKNRITKLGSKSHFYGHPPKHGKKYKYNSHFQDIICLRSSWEMLYVTYLDSQNILWFYEPLVFPIVINGIDATYTPDFYLPNEDKFIEVKGYWRDNSKDKIKFFKEQYPHIKLDIMFRKDLKMLGII